VLGDETPRTLSRLTLAEVIEPRIEETIHLLHNEIFKSGYKDLLGSGVVLTGGGSLLEGIAELSEFIFEMPVRRGNADSYFRTKGGCSNSCIGNSCWTDQIWCCKSGQGDCHRELNDR